MTAHFPPPPDQLLSTDEALVYLRGIGIRTSRSGLDRARGEGRLAATRVSGRVRILYRAADLVQAFIIEDGTWPLGSSGAAKPGTSAAPSQATAFDEDRRDTQEPLI